MPENETEPKITATQLIYHSAVSRGKSLYGYFNSPGVNVESHFYVQEDGDAEQYIDTGRQADANYKANVRAISVETWDNADPDRIPWTMEQLARLIDITVWAHRTHGIPLRWVPAWDEPGLGYHSLYQRIWTPGTKTCPGLARRPQVQQIIDGAVAVVNGQQPVIGGKGPVPVVNPVKKPGLISPPFPLSRCRRHGVMAYFGPKSGPDHSVSGYYGHRESLAYWQRRMKERGWRLDADGLYGPVTDRVAKMFQREKRLVVDGKIGPACWSAAWTAPVT